MLALEEVSVAYGDRIALRRLSFGVGPGESVGLVGRSGSGKSTAARCLTGLTPPDSGRVVFDGHDVRSLDRLGRKRFHLSVQLLPQDCRGALDRRTDVARALAEPALVHRIIERSRREEHVRRLLDLVRLPASTARRLPGELSGGQVQRVVLARALSVNPAVLVADEAVSALDPPTAAQVVNLWADLRDALGLALVFVGHDLALVGHVAQHVVVLQDGTEIACGTVDQLRRGPSSPQVRELFEATVQSRPSRMA